MSVRQVVMPLFTGIQPLDLTGPHEVLEAANRVMDALGRDTPRYELITVAEQAGLVRGESGLGMHADHSFETLAHNTNGIHTVLIPGGDGTSMPQPAVVNWLRTAGAKAERVVTICSGTFLAAEAGLCSGKRVTTHWASAGKLAERFPDLVVDPDPIYIRDGDFWSSAGVTSGIDLSLALVQHDCGAEVARHVARYLVVYLQRPGGQSQFATPVWRQPVEDQPIQEACDIIHAELDGDLSVGTLSSRVGMSERHFTRRFRTEVGETVARHVERHRVEAARQILETESVGLSKVATRCGFGTAETLRRAFHRRLEVSPDAYRRQFSSSR